MNDKDNEFWNNLEEDKVSIVCGYCDRNVNRCDNCGKKFEDKQKIFCFKERYHFCSEECAKSFFASMLNEAETYADW